MSTKIKYYVRSLPESERRGEISKHFQERLGDFEFWDNTHYESQEFRDAVSEGKIEVLDNYIERINTLSGSKFRRSGSDIMSPGQAANFYSMMKLFRKILDDSSDADMYGICEDDIIISKQTSSVFDRVLKDVDDDMYIIAVSWGMTRRHRMDFRPVELEKYRLRKNVFRMCNPFFFTNKETIRFVIRKFERMKISIPCDSWLHACLKSSSPEISRYAVYPCLVREMSFSGLLDSEVHPKAKRASYLRSKGQEVEAQKAQEVYENFKKNLRNVWRDNYGL